MKQKTNDQGMSIPTVLFLAFILIGGVLLIKNSMIQKAPNPENITTISDLDKASDELDRTDVDGLGNELPQINSDATTF